jgi:hypothetical protein
MIHWIEVAGWMGFPYLSQSNGISHSYALGYRLKDGGGEPWTTRFNRFKANEKAAVYGAARLFYGAVPKLMQSLQVNPDETVFITALSSVETTADANRALPFITKESARLVGVRFELDALRKNAHQKIHNFYSVADRNTELDKAEYKAKKLDAKKVFVFDDLITRGDTLSRIALAIQHTNPKSEVYGIALAKNESTAYCPNPDNAHIPAEWDTLWQQGEAEAAGARG